jgi:hypothetical protein
MDACSCAPTKKPLEESFASAGAVFIGTAIDVTEDALTRQKRIVFRSSEVFKGSKCQRKRFIVFTNMDSGMCGLGIRQGSQWQIWASGTPTRYTSYLCSESTTLVNNNIDFLRKQRGS